MQLRKHLLVVATTAALATILAGCAPQGNAPASVDAAAIAQADAAISQPAWLDARLPEHTVAYARIPSLWGTLAAPDGRPLDAALAAEQHVKLIAALRKAAQTDTVLTQAGAGPILNILLGDQGGPIEVAAIDSSDGVSPFSRVLVTTVLDVGDVAALNARIDALKGNAPSPLQAPIDAKGDAALQKFGALHFDAATHRLFLSLGVSASALTLEQDMAQLKTTRPSPMQDAEKEIDASGQGLFAWMSLKNLNTQASAQMQNQPPGGLLRDAVENAQSIALGWGTVDGHGRLQVQVRAPQARLLGYLSTKNPAIDLKTVGAPTWVATMALPGRDNLQSIHDNLDRDFGAGTRAGYDNIAAKMQEKFGIDLLASAGLYGKQAVLFGDADGDFTAFRITDRKALYARIDELSKRFGWRLTTTKVAGGEIHHLHVAIPESTFIPGSPDTQSAAWIKLYARIGSDRYWIEDGDWLVMARVPQPLIDRMADKPDTALGDWLSKHQTYDSTQTLLGFTTTTHDMNRRVYYTYLAALDSLGNALGAQVDLTALPTAKQLHLPTDGIAGIALQANEQRLALQVNYEQSPLEGVISGQGGAMGAVAVASILAAIAIPAYQDYVVRSQVAEGAMLSEGSKVAVAEYYSNTGRMPADNAAAGVATPTSIVGNYVSSVTIDNGRISVVYGGKANAAIRGGVLSFAPDEQRAAQNGSVTWLCDSAAGTTIPVKYRPTICR